MKKILLSLLIVSTLVGGLYFISFESTKNALIAVQKTAPMKVGSAQAGSLAQLATTSTVSVGPGTNKNILFNESTYCTSRTITTGANPIMLSFGTAQTTISTSTGYPGPNIGFLQPASTTATYDSGLFGCPAVSAYGYGASTTISIAEFR